MKDNAPPPSTRGAFTHRYVPVAGRQLNGNR